MKTIQSFSRNQILIISAFVILLLIWILMHIKSNNVHCQVDTIYTTTDPSRCPKAQMSLPYQCNQVILNPNIENYEELSTYLIKLGFQIKDTCNCEPSYELWENPAVNPIDVGTVVAEAPPARPIGNGLLLNIVFDLPDPIGDISTLSTVTNLDFPCSLNDSTIKIAIVDSGVDPDISTYVGKIVNPNWSPYNNITNNMCMYNANQRGIHWINNMYLEPNDSLGHGTSVNAIAIGASSPNFKVNSNGTKINIKIVNVGIMQEQTKNGHLFDALCGLNYAIKQQPNIINISWGFRFLAITPFITKADKAIMRLDTSIRTAFNSFFAKADTANIIVVAGAGNDTTKLNECQQFYPGSLANVNNNLISVGATNRNNNDIAKFSNYCDSTDWYVTLSAPGESIITAYPINLPKQNHKTGFVIQSGTSFATPFVSRLISMIKSLNYGLPSKEVKSRLSNLIITEKSLNDPVYYRRLDLSKFNDNICAFQK